MRLPEDITNEIQELDKTYLALRTTAENKQDDAALRLVLSGLVHQKMNLLTELEQSLITNNKHSIQYVFKTKKSHLEIKALMTNLSSFSRIVDLQLNRATQGKQKHLPIYLDTIFKGSFGVQLSTPTEAKLLDQDFEKAVGSTVDKLSELTNAPDDTVANIVRQTFSRDAALLSHFSALLKNMASTGEDVEVRWRSPVSQTIKQAVVTPAKASQLLLLFARYTTSEEETRIHGIIKGLSLIKYEVEFVVDNQPNNHVRAEFDVALSEQVISAINRTSVARLLITTTYDEVKEKPKRKYRLLSIDVDSKRSIDK